MLCCLVLASLLGLGCQRSRATTEAGSSEPDDAAAQTQQLEACAALEKTLESLPRPERAAAVLGRCGPVFRQPACRQAWQEAATMAPGARSQRLVSGCREAYCPLLKPAPNLCDMSLEQLAGLPVDGLVEVWMPFVLAALARDHGLEQASAFGHVPSIAPALVGP